MNKKEFLEEFEDTKPITEQEETTLILCLEELIESLKRKRQRGGYGIEMREIRDGSGNLIGFTRNFHIKLMEKL
jgi:hypothetical protein